METQPQCNNKIIAANEQSAHDCLINEFPLIELSIGRRRHLFTSPFEIKRELKGNFDVLRSVYYHSPQIKNYYIQNDYSVSGYKGLVYSPYLILRTSDKLKLAESLKAAKDIIQHLEAKFELDRSYLRFTFDGIQGIYIIFPGELFGGFGASADLPFIQSLIKSRLATGTFFDKFDYKTYYHNEMMPTLNTQRRLTGLYNVELTSEELFSLNENEIKSLASSRRSPVSFLDRDELDEIPQLKDLKDECRETYVKSRQYFDIVFSGMKGLIEIRPLGSLSDQIFYSNFFKDSTSAILYAQSLSGLTNVYFGLATRKDKDETGKERREGKKEDCLMLSVLYADVDFGKAGHKKEAYFKTKEEALCAIQSCSLPPSAVICSGHGFQAVWRLKEPVLLTDETTAAVEDTIWKLNKILHGDDVQNLDRIFRVPLTENVKESPAVLSEIVQINEKAEYSLLELTDWIEERFRILNPKFKCEPKTSKYYNYPTPIREERRPFDQYKYVFHNCPWLKNICLLGEKEQHLIHKDRLKLARLLVCFEKGEDEAKKVFSKCSDYKAGHTDYQLTQISQNGYVTPTCRELCGSSLCSSAHKYGVYKPIDLADLDDSYMEAENVSN